MPLPAPSIWLGPREAAAMAEAAAEAEGQRREATLRAKFDWQLLASETWCADLEREIAELNKSLEAKMSLADLQQQVHITAAQRRRRAEHPGSHAFKELVAFLESAHENERPKNVLACAEAAIQQVSSSRLALQQCQAQVWRATADCLPEAVRARDNSRKIHAEWLRKAQEEVIRAVAFGLKDSDTTLSPVCFQKALAEAEASVARARDIFDAARNAAFAEPHFGTASCPLLNTNSGPHLSAKAAVAAYRCYEQATDGTILAKATDAALAALHQAMRNVPAIDPFHSDQPALVGIDAAMRGACEALKTEIDFWKQRNYVTKLPCVQLCHAGYVALRARESTVAAVQDAELRYVALEAEAMDEMEAMDVAMSRDSVLRELTAALDEHLDVTDDLHDALQAVHRAQVRGKPVVSLDERVVEAKVIARRVDKRVSQAMLCFSNTRRRFPEVVQDALMLRRFLQVALPPELGAIWHVPRTLSYFDSWELLATASRRHIYRVTEEGRAYAVKEFPVSGAREGLRSCFLEAALLARAPHPHVAEILAIFSDPEEQSCFVQMPFYAPGSLGAWADSEQPDDLSIRRALAQVVSAVAHLHSLAIVHADIKPENILVDACGVAHLAIFDISLDSNSRTCSARMREMAAQVGFTPGFAAPELLQTGATAATDVFALGATISLVTPQSSERDAIARRLCAPDPVARPRYQEPLWDPFFAPVLAWLRGQRRRCTVCLEDRVPLEDGVECHRGEGGRHFLCHLCIEQHVTATMRLNPKAWRASEGRMHCPSRKTCESAAYLDADLARHLGARAFQRYTEARCDLLRQRLASELEGEMLLRIEAELRRLQGLAEEQQKVFALRNCFMDEVSTLRCPRCGRAVLDLSACVALACSHCPCGFCGWCGVDSGGSDARLHVQTCPCKPNGAGLFFRSSNEFEEAQRLRRERMLKAFLPTLDLQTRRAVLWEMRREFADLNLEGMIED